MYVITIHRLGIEVKTKDVRDVFAHIIAYGVTEKDIIFVE